MNHIKLQVVLEQKALAIKWNTQKNTWKNSYYSMHIQNVWLFKNRPYTKVSYHLIPPPKQMISLTKIGQTVVWGSVQVCDWK